VWWWLLFVAILFFFVIRSRSTDAGARRANSLLKLGCVDRTGQAVSLLARSCEECAKVIAKDSRHEFALQVWGTALWCLAKRSSGADADRLYADAEEKFAAALALTGDSVKLATDRFWALWERADLHPGAPGAAFLKVICDECERILRSRPDQTTLLGWWASSLSCLATRSAQADADLLFRDAEAKLEKCLTLHPQDAGLMTSLASVLWRRSKLHPGEEGIRLLGQAEDWVGKALHLKPADPTAILSRACVLFSRTYRLPGGESARRVDAAARELAAMKPGDDPDMLLLARGVMLWNQARCSAGDESTRLLREARDKLVEAASRRAPSAEYNLGCVCARLGELEESRQWLEKSREPGILVSRAQMATEQDLEGVRDCDWFQKMLGEP